MMETFSQRDVRWGTKFLGTSGLTMEHFGCVVTACAQALGLAGYPVDPGTVVDYLNNIGGFTDNNHPNGAGLLIWAKLQQAYPQISYTDNGAPQYDLEVGTLGKYSHWVLRDNATIYDPWMGTNQYPAGWKYGSFGRALWITNSTTPPPPAPEPTPAPPAPTPAPVFEYTVVSGDNLTSICAKHYGLATVGGDAYRKALDIAAYNGIVAPYIIRVGQVIKLP